MIKWLVYSAIATIVLFATCNFMLFPAIAHFAGYKLNPLQLVVCAIFASGFMLYHVSGKHR